MRKPMICTMLVDRKIGDFARTCSDAQLKVVGLYGVEYGVLHTDEDPFWIRIGPVTWSRGQYTHSELARYNLGICPICYGPLDHVHGEDESPLHKSVQASSQKAASSESAIPRKRKGRK